MITAVVGAGALGEARARHALGELRVIAGLPVAAEPGPSVAVVYDASEIPKGPAVVIPHKAAHVPRDVYPDYYDDRGVPVPVLFQTTLRKGEVICRTSSGQPLLVREGAVVHFGFDVLQATDYYLNGRGEAGWMRDRYGRPNLEAAPRWRREGVAVAVVNRYGALLARAVAAAAAGASWPTLVRFRYWPGGALFALALSHDVDRLWPPPWSETLRHLPCAALRGGRDGYNLRTLFKSRLRYRPLPALFAAEEAAGGVSTFFIGARRRGELDYDYDLVDVQPVIDEVRAAGREVALHSSYYTLDAQGLAAERSLLAGATRAEVAGVRGHWLRLAGEEAWQAAAAAGFTYDATFGFAYQPGWRGGAALPYRPFAADKPYDLVLIPLAVMDGSLKQYLKLTGAKALAAACRIVDEAKAVGGIASILWHYRSFPGGMFPSWGVIYEKLVRYAVDAGGLPLCHDAIARRYRFNLGISLKLKPTGEPDAAFLPAGDEGPVVLEVHEAETFAAAAGACPPVRVVTASPRAARPTPVTLTPN